MNLRVLLCVPGEPAKDIQIDGRVETIMKLLSGKPNDREPTEGWFSVMGLEKQLLLYCLEYPVNETFNRMIKNRPIFGNFLIFKFDDQQGARKSLSDEDVDHIVSNLLACKSNSTN